MELPVAGHLDAGEVDETSAGYFRRLECAPAFVSVEPFDHADHRTGLSGRLPRHGADSVIYLSIKSSAHAADRVERPGAWSETWPCPGVPPDSCELCLPRTEAEREACHGEQPESSRGRASSRLIGAARERGLTAVATVHNGVLCTAAFCWFSHGLGNR